MRLRALRRSDTVGAVPDWRRVNSTDVFVVAALTMITTMAGRSTLSFPLLVLFPASVWDDFF